MNQATLSGCRILILEDDFYQAHDSREFLELAGATIIAIGGSIPDLDELLRRGRVDGALIDINLGQELSFGFARRLQREGIPFLFLTGYDPSVLPNDLSSAPCLCKPAEGPRIVAELANAIARQQDSARSPNG